MQPVDLNNPSERKKLIVAVGLSLAAIVFLWWTFIGFGGSSTPRRDPSVAPQPGSTRAVSQSNVKTPREVKEEDLTQLQPVAYPQAHFFAADAKRNIFAYYEPPIALTGAAVTPTPTPTPTPPLMLASVSPANVYARTSDFTLEVTGDKFSPEVRISVDGQDLPTRHLSPQQLSTTVPAAIIANAGQRQVSVRSPDGRLYSNAAVLNVSQPPTPNYTYVGILGTKRYVDIALIQDRSNKEILNVQRGDVLAGRFRVTSISEKELVLVDTNLKIKHSLPMSGDGEKGSGPQSRPTPKVDAEDDEP